MPQHKNQTSFKKGHKSWNKGIKGLHFSPQTEFKKGRKNPNKKKIGFLSQRMDKTGKVRTWIKIKNPNKWEYYSRYLWKQKYGFILKGDVIHHLNGDTLDDRIENLIALPRSDHPLFHNRYGLKELTKKQLDFYKNKYDN